MYWAPQCDAGALPPEELAALAARKAALGAELQAITEASAALAKGEEGVEGGGGGTGRGCGVPSTPSPPHAPSQPPRPTQQNRSELAVAQSSLTPEQVQERTAALEADLPGLRSRMAALASAPVVSDKDKAAVEQKLADGVAAWSRRKRMFADCWDAVSENMDANPKSVLAEIGVETDADVGVDLAAVRGLSAKVRRSR